MKLSPPVLDKPKPYKPPIGNIVYGSVVVLTYNTHKKNHVAVFEFFTKAPIQITTEQGLSVVVQFSKTDLYVAEIKEWGEGWHPKYFSKKGGEAARREALNSKRDRGRERENDEIRM